jgi:hypothetical protein
MSKDNKMMFLALALGVYVMTKRPVSAATIPRSTTGPMNNLPASVGTGAGQVLGGALGGMLQSWFKGSSTAYVPDGSGASPAPDWDAAYQQNPELMDNVMMYGV